MTAHHPNIVLICGYATAGKDAVGRALTRNHGMARIAFADALKERAVNGYLIDGKMWYWDGKSKGPLERANLQYIGESERARDPFVWIRKALDRMDELPGRSIVVTDGRYWNECEAMRDRGALIWHIERPGVFAANAHESEHQWRRYLKWYPADATIVNDCDDAACSYARDPSHGLCESLAETVAREMEGISGAG